MPAKWEKRFARIHLLGKLALTGAIFLIGVFLTSGSTRTFCMVSALFLIVPALIYTYVVIHLHWKDRYRGDHSDLWGVLILVETTGWLKLVYLFRHLIPDMQHTGRYQLDPFQPLS
jgi:hypothetical protein